MIQCTQTRPDGIREYTLENDDLKVIVSSYGVTLLEIDMKDPDGTLHPVTIGYPSIEGYMEKSGTYLGALVGRTCNRLAKGHFTLNGIPYQIAVNNGPNSLHGGRDGFSYQNFDAKIDGDTLRLFYRSADGEEGYPGQLDLCVALKLEGNTLSITYDAQCDADTLCSLTHHTYFNLAQDHAAQADVSGHLLQVGALRHGLVDGDGLFTGQFREVIGTPLDFTKPAPVHQGYDQSDPQVRNALGIDHHFVFEEGLPQVILQDPDSGRTLEVETTSPGVQLYSGNYLQGIAGRGGLLYDAHAGLAIEPQIVPDSIHTQEHPQALLKAGTPYHQEILYRFTTR